MNDRAEIKEMLTAEKRTLKLLDARLKELESLMLEEEMPEWQEAAKRQPFFYSAIDGVDGLPGIRLTDFQDVGVEDDNIPQAQRAKVFEGLVTIQSDAPFVWTHILTVQTQFDKFYASIQNTGSIDMTSGTSLQELGFIENGSGRVLFQADRGKETGELLSAAFFDHYRLIEASEPFPFESYRPGAYANGHGPNLPFELPAETVLPMNGSITVQAKPLIYNIADNELADARLYVSLLGYKVFGD